MIQGFIHFIANRFSFDLIMQREQLIFLLLLIIFIKSAYLQKNNVCPSYEDYYTIANNSKCWYDLAAENDVVSTF